jgi:hypothetical protein
MNGNNHPGDVVGFSLGFEPGSLREKTNRLGLLEYVEDIACIKK